MKASDQVALLEADLEVANRNLATACRERDVARLSNESIRALEAELAGETRKRQEAERKLENLNNTWSGTLAHCLEEPRAKLATAEARLRELEGQAKQLRTERDDALRDLGRVQEERDEARTELVKAWDTEHARAELLAAKFEAAGGQAERLRGELATVLAERDGAVSIATQVEREFAAREMNPMTQDPSARGRYLQERYWSGSGWVNAPEPRWCELPPTRSDAAVSPSRVKCSECGRRRDWPGNGYCEHCGYSEPDEAKPADSATPPMHAEMVEAQHRDIAAQVEEWSGTKIPGGAKLSAAQGVIRQPVPREAPAARVTVGRDEYPDPSRVMCGPENKRINDLARRVTNAECAINALADKIVGLAPFAAVQQLAAGDANSRPAQEIR